MNIEHITYGYQEKKITNKNHPEYDLWLIEKTNSIVEKESVNINAMIDIKSYTPGKSICPTSKNHSQLNQSKTVNEIPQYFGFINFERSFQPFSSVGEIQNLSFEFKFFILHAAQVAGYLAEKETDDHEAGAILFEPNKGHKLKTLDDLMDYDEDGGSKINIEKIKEEDFYKNNQITRAVAPAALQIKTPKYNRNVILWPTDDKTTKYFQINFYKKDSSSATNKRAKLKEKIINYIESKIDPNWKRQDTPIEFETICRLTMEYFSINSDEKIIFNYLKDPPDKIEKRAEEFIDHFYRYFHFSFIKTRWNPAIYDESPRLRSARLSRKKIDIYKKYKNFDNFYFKNGVLKDYFDEVKEAINWSQNKKSEESTTETSSHKTKGNIISENVLRNIIRNILEEGDKKKNYSGSHPEESYGWSAKEEDFMFDLPGLTTWEEDRQWVKEYLKSMGMLKNKK